MDDQMWADDIALLVIDNKVWVVDVRTVSGYCLMYSQAL